MNLRQLRYFIVLAEELHFRRAAERLNITQSPLTLAIQELERELGGALFQRSRRRVELTEAGAAFQVGAREVLDKMQASLQTTRDLLSGQSQRLRIGLASAAALPRVVETTLQAFRAAHPDVQVIVRELATDEDLRSLSSRELDVCVMRVPSSRLPAQGRSIKLLRESLVVAMHRDHPLRTRTALTLAELRDETLITYPRYSAPVLHECISRACAKYSFTPRIAHESRDTATLLGLVVARQGLAILPSELSRFGLPQLLFTPIADPEASTDLYLVCRHDETDPRVEALWRRAENGIGSLQIASATVTPFAPPRRKLQPRIHLR
jgi:DNA-binding transcriptional LysR family regulator